MQRRRFALRTLWGVLRNIAALMGAVWILVTVTPVTRWLASPLAGPWLEPRGEILIVLAADGPEHGLIGLASYWRTVYALACWREGGIRTVIVSGGDGAGEAMANFMSYAGIPKASILVENRSTSTRENALFTAELLKNMPGKKVLLTADFHVYRSARCFQKAGVAVETRFFPYALKRANGWLDRWPVFLDLCLEYAKIVVYSTRGWI